MKKIIALVLCAAMLHGSAGFAERASAAALPETGYSDYVPGDMPVNMMDIDQTAARTFSYNAGRNTRNVDCVLDLSVENWSDNAKTYSPLVLKSVNDVTVDAGNKGFWGIVSKQVQFEGGRNYVFSVPMKKTSGDEVYIGAALTNEKDDGLVYSRDLGQDGIAVSDTEQLLKATFSTPDADYSQNHVLVIGFARDTKSGANIEFNMSYADAVYFGEEQAYNINCSLLTPEEEVAQGSSIRLKAEVVNQIGIKGNLSQDIEWAAFNADRSARVDGFDFEVGADGIATVRIDKNVANGEYTLAAASGTYDGFVKSVTIKLSDSSDDGIDISKLKDYERDGITAPNLMDIDKTATRTFANNAVRNDTCVDQQLGRTWVDAAACFGPFYLESISDIKDAGTRAFFGSTHSMIALENDKAYVLSLPIKKIAGDDVKIGAALTNSGNGVVYSNEYGSGGVSIGDESRVYSFSLKPSPAADYTNNHLIVIGFPAGTKAGAKVEIDVSKKDNIYFAEEQAYDIRCAAVSAAKEICQGENIQVKAEVLNQIEMPGNLNQGFKWIALNEDKTQRAEGFKFRTKEDGTATVSISADTPVGRYAFAAISKEYDGFIKTMYIDVKPRRIYDKTTSDDGKYSISVNAAGNDVLNVGDKVKLTATVTPDADGEIKWYVVDENRNTYADWIEPKADGENAEIVIDEFSRAGEYYVIAEKELENDTIRASAKISVEVPELWQFARDNLGSMSAQELASVINKYAKALDIDFVSDDEYSYDAASALVLSSHDKDLDTEQAVKEIFESAIAASLFMKNPKNLALCDNNGDFTFENELHLDNIDTNNITVWQNYKKYLSASGKKELAGALVGEYADYDAFLKKFAVLSILGSIKSPAVGGTGYISEILTKENTDFAGINVNKYLNASNKSDYNSFIARKSYTVAELEKAVAEYSTNSGSGSGSGGGSSGGGSSVPSGSGSKVQISYEPKYEMFTDVAEGHWAFADIYELRQRGIISGVSENEFAPETTVTREQLVKMICDAFDIKPIDDGSSFSDVDAGAWYAPYIEAASRNELISGIGSGMFGIGSPIKREDICVIIYRAMNIADGVSGELAFADNDDIDDYAKDAVAYLSSYGVINGFEDNTFRPAAYCTRAQAARILCGVLNVKGVIEK